MDSGKRSEISFWIALPTSDTVNRPNSNFFKDNVANMWAQFIKESRISDPEPDFEALEYKNGHCLISLDYYEWYKMVRILIS